MSHFYDPDESHVCNLFEKRYLIAKDCYSPLVFDLQCVRQK